VKMIEWTKDHIVRLGGAVTVLPNPVESEERPLPPILLGEFHVDPKLKTVCVYGHLDVQPAAKEDGWDTDPFVLTEKDGKLFGRGSTDDKGPALSWLWIVEAHQALGIDLPVNIKILYEGMEEYGSDGMFETIAEEAKEGKFLNDVDFFCISDNYWLGKAKPCVTYGLRGLAYFELSVQGCEQDLHSGEFSLDMEAFHNGRSATPCPNVFVFCLLRL
jgi:nonspecific dipeptidase